jgi:hypothetical protein
MVGVTKFISVNLQENLLRQLVRDDFFEKKELRYLPLNTDCRCGCEKKSDTRVSEALDRAINRHWKYERHVRKNSSPKDL